MVFILRDSGIWYSAFAAYISRCVTGWTEREIGRTEKSAYHVVVLTLTHHYNAVRGHRTGSNSSVTPNESLQGVISCCALGWTNLAYDAGRNSILVRKSCRVLQYNLLWTLLYSYSCGSQVKAQSPSGHIFHARSCVRRDYPSFCDRRL